MKEIDGSVKNLIVSVTAGVAAAAVGIIYYHLGRAEGASITMNALETAENEPEIELEEE